jgi:hypothetical protein
MLGNYLSEIEEVQTKLEDRLLCLDELVRAMQGYTEKAIAAKGAPLKACMDEIEALVYGDNYKGKVNLLNALRVPQVFNAS